MRRPVVSSILVLVLAACTGAPPGAPTGPMRLTAVFDDVASLRVGNNVVVADVPVGSVVSIELTDDNRARTTVALDDLQLPRETIARIGQSSALGDNYVELVRPEGGGCPCLASGDTVERTRTAPQVEAIVGQLGVVLASITGNDLATIVEESAAALSGRGETLNRLFADLEVVADTFADQSRTLTRTIDRLDDLTATLADGDAQVERLLDQAARATRLLADNRQRIVDGLEQLSRVARVSVEESLGQHRETTAQQVRKLRGIVREVAEGQEVIESILVNGARSLKTGLGAITPHDYVYTYEIVPFDQPQSDGEGG